MTLNFLIPHVNYFVLTPTCCLCDTYFKLFLPPKGRKMGPLLHLLRPNARIPLARRPINLCSWWPHQRDPPSVFLYKWGPCNLSVEFQRLVAPASLISVCLLETMLGTSLLLQGGGGREVLAAVVRFTPSVISPSPTLLFLCILHYRMMLYRFTWGGGAHLFHSIYH